jgi:hypothetical protein
MLLARREMGLLQLTNFTTDRIRDFEWTPDSRLILAHGPVSQDVVLISNRQSR